MICEASSKVQRNTDNGPALDIRPYLAIFTPTMEASADPFPMRTMPAHSRSAATLEAILAASLGVLEEFGLPGFNTNAVAKAARVNVATLYHYFPNKNAILQTLFERNESGRTAWIVSQLGDLPTTKDLEGWIRQMGAGLHEHRRNERAGVELRRACRAVPELMAAEKARTAVHANALADVLRQRFPHQSLERLQTSARIIVEVNAAVLDAALESPDRAEAIISELACLMTGYFTGLATP